MCTANKQIRHTFQLLEWFQLASITCCPCNVIGVKGISKHLWIVVETSWDPKHLTAISSLSMNHFNMCNLQPIGTNLCERSKMILSDFLIFVSFVRLNVFGAVLSPLRRGRPSLRIGGGILGLAPCVLEECLWVNKSVFVKTFYCSSHNWQYKAFLLKRFYQCMHKYVFPKTFCQPDQIFWTIYWLATNKEIQIWWLLWVTDCSELSFP